jgi:hypothetical protein
MGGYIVTPPYAVPPLLELLEYPGFPVLARHPADSSSESHRGRSWMVLITSDNRFFVI